MARHATLTAIKQEAEMHPAERGDHFRDPSCRWCHRSGRFKACTRCQKPVCPQCAMVIRKQGRMPDPPNFRVMCKVDCG
jgi:hypothetical protein